MQLWIDNTGLQSAGMCLDGRASLAHDYDVRGLLQLATFVIYGNKVSLNGFEDDIVANRSHEIVEQLRTCGITEDILSISPVNENEYALACKTAADSIATNLCDGLNFDEYKLLGLEPPDLPRGLQERQFTYVALANEHEDSAKLLEIEENALTEKAAGAVEYMVACSPKLREAIARILTAHPDWGNRNSYALNILLRYHLNDALGEQSFSKYAPAVARAELVSRRNQYVIEALGNTLDKTVSDLRSKFMGVPLGVPSTLSALLQRAKGEPRAILSVAREFREHSRPLRDMLGSLTSKYPEDSPESRFEINKQVEELGLQMRRDVGLEKASKLSDALEIQFLLGIPVPSVSGKEIVRWAQEQAKSRRTAVLTELVKASAYSDFSTQLYGKLCERSTEKSRR